MAYLQRYDSLKEKKTAQSRNIKIPAKTKVISAEFDEVLLYGLRPLDPRIDSMSPWIFVQWWFGKRLRKPNPPDYILTVSSEDWTPADHDGSYNPVGGKDFIVNEEAENKSALAFLP